MSKKECKHEEWNPCGNDFYSCRKCGILRTSQQVNLYIEKDRQIADLEIKLTQSKMSESFEKEKKDNAFKLIEELKQQLVEKEREIERIKINYVGGLQNANKATRIFKEEYYKADQDKISFAIKQLEKARTQFRTKYTWYEETHRVCEKTDDFVIWLDNQIKELKEGK